MTEDEILFSELPDAVVLRFFHNTMNHIRIKRPGDQLHHRQSG